jgi:hypothetical protein
MAAITGSTYISAIPNLGKTLVYIETPATVESADTIDVASYLSSIDMVVQAWDKTSAIIATATVSGTVITIDAAGGTTDHTYALLVMGTKA